MYLSLRRDFQLLGGDSLNGFTLSGFNEYSYNKLLLEVDVDIFIGIDWII